MPRLFDSLGPVLVVTVLLSATANTKMVTAILLAVQLSPAPPFSLLPVTSGTKAKAL